MRSKRLLFLSIVLLAAAAVCIFALLYFRFNPAGTQVDENEKIYSRYYAMICDDRNSSFWQRVYQGMTEAAENSDCYVEFLGADLNSELSTQELMDIAISSVVDGIMVLGNEREDMTALIDKATDRGIPVVTMYTDNADSKRCSFVGVSAYSIGKEYGRQILNAVTERDRLAGEDVKRDNKVTVLFDNSNLLYDHNLIISGIGDVLSREGEGMVFLTDSVAVDDVSPFSVEESIRDIFMQEEIPDILVCLSELDTTCAYQALIDHNLVGSVYILGYHDSEKILNAINRNVVYSTLAVDTAEMGRHCLEALDEYIESGNTNQYFSTDVTMIDRNNVSAYLIKEDGDEKKD
ncbi:MAG: substrate-binding domain-containing protein [Lachnospiraceae bacterium]|nr:substrate-binding domain-containing protein [Lachnospiraceae bacterium]